MKSLMLNSGICEASNRYSLNHNWLRKREFVERASSLLQGILAAVEISHDPREIKFPRRPQKPAAMLSEGGIIVG
jgi:hypothetical protein